MRFISLIDTISQNIITIDADALVLRLEIDGHPREQRLKPYHGEILYALFSKHPVALSYEEITEFLKMHKLVITDLTRMHRKLSEIRNILLAFHPSLGNLILNTRGVGYSLPLQLKNLHHLKSEQTIQFKNPKLADSIITIKELIEESVNLTAENKICHHAQGYVINRDPIRSKLVEKVIIFNKCEKIILQQIRSHEADFTGIRVQYLLAKLRTYIGLARISEYPISETQWLDWFKQEVWQLFEDFKKLVKLAESL